MDMLKFGTLTLYGLKILIILAMGGSLWFLGLVLFSRVIPVISQEPTFPTDGIVVFTGGKTRLRTALDLFQQNKGKYLLISGVNPDSTFPDTIKQLPGKSQVTLGYDALDTVGNAEETAEWARAHHLKTLRLITSNYHMPRSLFELHRLLPEVQIFSHAVVEEVFLAPKWWLNPFALNLVIQEYNKFLFSLIRRPLEDIKGLLFLKIFNTAQDGA